MASKTLEYDGVIIGAGHNALILAAYLSRCGFKVVALEKNAEVGGGLSTFEDPTYGGFLHNMHSVFHRLITELPWYRDLEVEKFGVQYLFPDANNGMPMSDGKCLVLYKELSKSCKAISAFSKKDAKTFERLYTHYSTMCRKIWLAELFSAPLQEDEREALLQKSALGREFLEIDQHSGEDLVNEMYESDPVRAQILYMVGVRAYDPTKKKTGFVVPAMTFLANKSMLCRGGSRMLGRGLERAVLNAGGDVRLFSEVNRIIVKNGRAIGVETTSGDTYMARKFVVSSVDPKQTFLRMVGADNLEKDFARSVKGYKFGDVALFAAHASLNEAPRYESARYNPDINRTFDTNIGYENPDLLVKHFKQCAANELPTELGLQAACPSVFDPSQAPPGKAVVFAWQFAPYKIKGEDADEWDRIKNDYANKCFDKWAKYAPNMKPNGTNFINSFGQSPLDTQRHMINMVNGDMHSGAVIPGQMRASRPVPGASGYRTPIEHLYMTGSSTHPHGNVNGGPGYNAASVIAMDFGAKIWWSPKDVRKLWANLE